jgi:hypothetical protein
MVALDNKPQLACMTNHVTSLSILWLDVAQSYRSEMLLM